MLVKIEMEGGTLLAGNLVNLALAIILSYTLAVVFWSYLAEGILIAILTAASGFIIGIRGKSVLAALLLAFFSSVFPLMFYSVLLPALLINSPDHLKIDSAESGPLLASLIVLGISNMAEFIYGHFIGFEGFVRRKGLDTVAWARDYFVVRPAYRIFPIIAMVTILGFSILPIGRAPIPEGWYVVLFMMVKILMDWKAYELRKGFAGQ
jgi:hypothetical protein